MIDIFFGLLDNIVNMKKKFTCYVVGFFVIDILLSLPCDKNLACDGPSAIYFQYPSLWVLILVPLSLLAIALNDQKYKFWLKFTGIFFATSMIVVFLMPEYDSAIVSVDRELTNWFFLGLYSFISIVYFIVQFFKNKKQFTLVK